MPRKKGGETLWCLPAKVERFSCVSCRRSLRSLKLNSQVKSVTTTRCHNLARSKRLELIRWWLLRLTNMSETVTAPRLTQTWRRGSLGCSVSQVPPLFPPLSSAPAEHFLTFYSSQHGSRMPRFFFLLHSAGTTTETGRGAVDVSLACVCVYRREVSPFSKQTPTNWQDNKKKNINTSSGSALCHGPGGPDTEGSVNLAAQTSNDTS